MTKTKLIFGLVLLLIIFGCNQDNIKDKELLTQVEPLTQVDMSDWHLGQDDLQNRVASGSSDKCASMAVLRRQLNENPGLGKKMYNIEKKARAFIASKKGGNGGNGNGGNGNSGGGTGGGTTPIDDGLGIINIPVIVHVVYNTSQQNISDAQIQSQIDVLNKDFRAQNSDINNTPAEFADDVDDMEIQFTLSQVIRKSTSVTSFGTNDAIKYSSQGGDDAVTPSTHLNIWVGEIGGGILGYAQFPGGAAATDGVVIAPQYFGNTGYVSSPYDGGRTATHEVGHWLNLRHIWGDGRCKQDDFVADTPSSNSPNYNCPSYPTVKCRTTDMTMNYMDYVNDACMYMFTTGQKQRARAIFASSGPRSSFAN